MIKHLAELAGVKYEIVHSHTTADHPETVYFVRGEMRKAIQMGIKYTIEYPHYKGKRTSIWERQKSKGRKTWDSAEQYYLWWKGRQNLIKPTKTN